MSSVRLVVCVTCRGTDDDDRPGRHLHEALKDRVPIEAVECLSVCKRPCSIALSGEGRWTYVIGDVDQEVGAAEILAVMARYAAAPDGIIPWQDRPEWFRKGVVARVPPAV